MSSLVAVLVGLLGLSLLTNAALVAWIWTRVVRIHHDPFEHVHVVMRLRKDAHRGLRQLFDDADPAPVSTPRAPRPRPPEASIMDLPDVRAAADGPGVDLPGVGPPSSSAPPCHLCGLPVPGRACDNCGALRGGS